MLRGFAKSPEVLAALRLELESLVAFGVLAPFEFALAVFGFDFGVFGLAFGALALLSSVTARKHKNTVYVI